MQSKSLMLLVVALACGIIASIGITQVMARRSGAPKAPKVETAPVFVVKEDIPVGSQLTVENLKLEQWPKDKVPEGALGKLEDLEGRRPRTKLYAGEPILSAKILGDGEGDIASEQIPIGYRSVPVRVDEVSGGAAMIWPGDRVDVLVYAKQGNGIPQTLTKTILQDIKVFAVDAKWSVESDESGNAIRAKTISLLLSPDQTERVMLAHELGKIRLALRSPDDHEEAELSDTGYRIGQVFGETEIADLEKDDDLIYDEPEPVAPLIALVPGPEQEPLPSHTVRVISGSQVQQVVMQGTQEEVGNDGKATSAGSSAASFLWNIISAPGKKASEQDEAKPEADTKTKPNTDGDKDGDADADLDDAADLLLDEPDDAA